jgi:hypothetical protein
MKNIAPRPSACASVRTKCFGLRVDLDDGAGHEAGVGGRVDRRAQRRRPVGPGEGRFGAAPGTNHAALVPLPAVPVQQLHRQRVQHLVADDHAVQPLGQRGMPFDALADGRQPRALARMKRPRQFHHVVAAQRRAQRFDQLRCQHAGAGAELPQLVGLRGLERLRNCNASACANSGDISGAVAKSLPSCGNVPKMRCPRA